MKLGRRYSIVLVGAGNVATHLAPALHRTGHKILCVYSRSKDSASLLAGRVGALWTTNMDDLPGEADFYIISVRDNALEEVVSQLTVNNGVVMHTTGSAGMEIFEGKFTDYGVFYPFQTFRKEQDMDMSTVPLLIEANSIEGLKSIRSIAESISPNVHDFNSAMRANLHLTAAFACNFTNYMVTIAESLLQEQSIDRKLLTPLIEETFRKISNGPAWEMQTGPAVRGDTNTMKKHFELLKNHPEWQKLYTFMSQLIQSNDKF